MTRHLGDSVVLQWLMITALMLNFAVLVVIAFQHQVSVTGSGNTLYFRDAFARTVDRCDAVRGEIFECTRIKAYWRD